MDKTILLFTHVNKSSVQAGHNLPHLADIDIANLYFITRLVLVQLYQLFIF